LRSFSELLPLPMTMESYTERPRICPLNYERGPALTACVDASVTESINRSRRRPLQRSSGLIVKAAAAVLATAYYCSTSAIFVNGLQPQRQQPVKPKSPLVTGRTSMSLEYQTFYSEAQDKEMKSKKGLVEDHLMKLQMEMKKFPSPVVKVTMEGQTHKRQKSASASYQKKSSKAAPKKIATTRRKKVVNKRRSSGSSTTTGTSQLSASTKRLIRKTQVAVQSARMQLESVYSMHPNPRELLTREEEIMYTNQIRALRSAEQVRDAMTIQLRSIHSDSHEEDLFQLFQHNRTTEAAWAQACGFSSTAQLRQVLSQGQDARLQLVQANMGLVTSIAKRQYASLKRTMEAGSGVGTCLTLADFQQEGQLGLMEAAERFDPERSVKFSTYATWWIRQRILRSVSDSSRIIRLPAHGTYTWLSMTYIV
jgi:hypothetical protein